jgi:hypothetical protein
LRRLARLTCRPGIREDVVQGAHLEYLTHLQAGRRVDSIGGLCRSMMLKAVRLEVRWWRINQQGSETTIHSAVAPAGGSGFWERSERLPEAATAAIAAQIRGFRSKAVFVQWARGWSVAAMAAANRQADRPMRKAEEDIVRLLARLQPRVFEAVQRLGISWTDVD